MTDTSHYADLRVITLKGPESLFRLVSAAWRWAADIRRAFLRNGPVGLTPDLLDGPYR